MLRHERQIRAWVQRLVDASLFGLGLWMAYVLRHASGIEVFGGSRDIQPFSEYLGFFLILPLTPLLLEHWGYYDPPLASRRQSAWILFKACATAVGLTIFGLFLVKDAHYSRGVVILFGLCSFAGIFLKDEVVRRAALAAGTHRRRRLILAGSAEDTDRVLPAVHRGGLDGPEVVARIDLNQQSIEELIELMHRHSANAVMISARHTYFGQVEKAIQACELEGVEAWLLADFFKTQVSRTSLDELSGRPVLVFRSAPAHSWRRMAKQAMDFVGAAVLLLAMSWLFLVAALAIRWNSKGPIFFRQKRAGLNGRPFMMLKFRSMVSNAEQRKHELERLNEMAGPVFKLTDDPRVTSVGRLLRKWSIDELPQLVNVLRGEMSLVGPRPLPVDEVERFDDLAYRRRLSVKPGLTCLWQVSGRSSITDFREWVRLDLLYIDNWSFWLDLRILAKTIPAVMRGTGAR